MAALLTLLGIAGGIGGIGALVVWSQRVVRERTAALRAIAERRGWSFREKAGLEVVPEAERFELFRKGHGRKVRNFMAGDGGGARAAVFDYQYTTGGGRSQATWRQTVACIHLGEGRLPAFSLRPEHVFHRVGGVFGYQDIDMEGHPEFSAAYLLRGSDEGAVRAAFTPAAAEFFEARRKLSAEGGGPVLLLWRAGRQAKPEEVEGLLADAAELARRLRQAPSSQVAMDM